MTEEEITEGKRAAVGSAASAERGSRSLTKAMIAGGAILIITGVALAVYMGLYEDEPFLIALGPAFIGVMIVIAALFGKRL